MRCFSTCFAGAGLLLALLWGCGLPLRDGLDSVRIDLATVADGSRHFEVRNLEAWCPVEEASWSKTFRVYTIFDKTSAGEELPPLTGSYEFQDGVLRFSPRFPLEPGLGYSARIYFSPGRIKEVRFDIPAEELEPATMVVAVYPSADLLPENLLKFYIHFSSPMSVGRSYEQIRLLDAKGEVVRYPFLELDEELWDPSGRRLTVFIDPGRIKQGVLPNSVVGPVFKAGRRYTLVISEQWKDSAGAPLRSSFRKSFKVSRADRESPEPASWKLAAPAAGSLEPLALVFGAPLDHALLQRLLWVEDQAGTAVEGEITVQDEERRWSFRPLKKWSPGRYRLMVRSTLEDLAGNGIDKPFEIDVFEQVRSRVEAKIVSREFTVSRRRR